MEAVSGLFPLIVGVTLGALLSFFASHYWFVKSERVKSAERIALANDRLVERIVELEEGQALLRQQALPVTAVMQAILIKELTHPHAIVLDKLLEKIGPPWVLTEKEEVLLNSELAARADEPDETVDDLERDAARMLMMVVRRAQAEAMALRPAKILLTQLPTPRDRAA